MKNGLHPAFFRFFSYLPFRGVFGRPTLSSSPSPPISGSLRISIRTLQGQGRIMQTNYRASLKAEGILGIAADLRLNAV